MGATAQGGLVTKAYKSSQVHPQASKFTDTIQNPFHSDVAAIVDPLGEKRKAGTLTYQDALTGSAALEERITKFDTDKKAFAGAGTHQGIVAGQADETLNPIIAAWRKTFADDLARLKPADQLLSDVALNPDGTPKDTRQFPKASGPNGQRRQQVSPSSILGGFNNAKPAKVRKETLLGY